MNKSIKDSMIQRPGATGSESVLSMSPYLDSAVVFDLNLARNVYTVVEVEIRYRVCHAVAEGMEAALAYSSRIGA